MIGKLISGAVKAVVGVAGSAFEKHADNKTKRKEFEHDLAMAIIGNESGVTDGLMAIGLAETNGTSYQRNWRPTLMYSATFLILWMAVAGPLIQVFTGMDLVTPTRDSFATVPEELWWVLGVGLGVFGAGRSLEKGVKHWKNGGS